MKNIIKIMLLMSAFALSGCFLIPVHKLDVQQGNVITPGMLNALKPGMSKQQIQYLMGTPVLENPFNPNRWDYVYYFKPGYGKISTRQLVLYFKGDTLTGIVGPFEHGPQNSPPQKSADLSETLAPVQLGQRPVGFADRGLPLPFSN